MNKNNDFDDLNKEFKQLSKNLKSVLDSLTKKIQSLEKNSVDTDEIIELIESYKKKDNSRRRITKDYFLFRVIYLFRVGSSIGRAGAF